MTQILSPRVRLEFWTTPLIHAAMHNRAQLSALLQANIPPSWPNSEVAAYVLPSVNESLAAHPTKVVWGGPIIHRLEQMVIGTMGFKDSVESGAVEVGYDIVPEYRGHGYATEMARALFEWTFAQPGVSRIVAECLASNAASIRVLEKSGMRLVDDDGALMRWELEKR